MACLVGGVFLQSTSPGDAEMDDGEAEDAVEERLATAGPPAAIPAHAVQTTDPARREELAAAAPGTKYLTIDNESTLVISRPFPAAISRTLNVLL